MGVRGVEELASTSQHVSANSLHFGRYGRRLRGASGGSAKQGLGAVLLTARFDSVRSGSKSRESVGLREVSLHVGVPEFALTVAESGEQGLAQKASFGCG